ncbi:hypothetical protein BKG89_04650 [Rodentibacter caecimuris]|uniref:Uncharacterized protein n=1 Tax=Rodentibacter caecimuris TaxID=1796644 RepID=A0ABX3L1H9_9PAST|nr:hypothetical protein BKG89_04650 [Rodentibacter heylii]
MITDTTEEVNYYFDHYSNKWDGKFLKNIMTNAINTLLEQGKFLALQKTTPKITVIIKTKEK